MNAIGLRMVQQGRDYPWIMTPGAVIVDIMVRWCEIKKESPNYPIKRNPPLENRTERISKDQSKGEGNLVKGNGRVMLGM